MPSMPLVRSHGIILVLLILLTVPVSHIFKSTLCQSNNKNASDLKLFNRYKDIKICLYCSLILSYTYILIAAWHTLFYIGLFTRDSFPLNHWQCRIFGIAGIISYSVGRALLYLFFMIRTYHTFESTNYRYPFCCMSILLVFTIICATLFIAPSIYVEHSIDYTIDTQGRAQWCQVVNNDENLERYQNRDIMYAFGTFIDCAFAIICVYLLTSRLFKMVRTHSKKTMDFGKGTPYFRMKDLEDDDNDENGSVLSFHTVTASNNGLILMICKMTILLIIVLISSQVTIIMYTFFGDGVYIYYSLDTCINTYCLWLSFGFAKHIYYRYFCGKACIQCWFPLCKTVAISCECCKCNDLSKKQQKQIYKLAKVEINEMIEL